MDHEEIPLDPNEQAAHRYRLFSRAIKITGLAQIATLQPYLRWGSKGLFAKRLTHSQRQKQVRVVITVTVRED